MELLQLRYFKELAESEHLTNTAKKLMISAPSAIAWEKDSDISTANHVFLNHIIEYCRKNPHL